MGAPDLIKITKTHALGFSMNESLLDKGRYWNRLGKLLRR